MERRGGEGDKREREGMDEAKMKTGKGKDKEGNEERKDVRERGKGENDKG